MSVLFVKDSQRLEVIRPYVETDPLYFSILNRPLEDVEQRTKDLDRIFTPSRGFRIRSTSPASASVEREAGVYVSVDTTINQVVLATIAIPAATAGNIRVDLLWFNLETGATVRTAGGEIAVGSGFAAAPRPPLPANDAAIPLAYVYVNETPTPFNEIIAINNAGHIQDVRPAIGSSRRVFEDTAANLLTDVAGGSVGTSAKVVRADHRHPLNVDGTTPATLGPDVVGAVGGAATYARRDHAHTILTETNAGAFLTDVAGGSVGTSANFPRADHRHPLNVSVANPAPLGGAATPGTSAFYSRHDHVHAISGLIQAQTGTAAVVLWGEVASNGAISKAGSGGWTSVRDLLGRYTVTFTSSFSVPPVIILTPRTTDDNVRAANTRVVTAGSFTAQTTTLDNAFFDVAWDFVAIAVV